MERVQFLNFNAYRSVDIQKLRCFLDTIKTFNSSIVTIQEIHVGNALKVFQNDYRVFINVEQHSRDLIGICTLVKNNLKVKDVILGENGRIIGVLLDSLKVFNVYPKSGTQNRRLRENFFRQELPHIMKFWDDDQMDVILAGDYNCIHRKQDSLNNPDAHFQPGLVKFMESFGLSDDFLSANGNISDVYSRVTSRSKTRIDLILSNSKKCDKFEYRSFPFLDHKMIVAEYSIHLASRFSKIPKERFFSGWVIGRELEHDEVFGDVVDEILNQIDFEAGLSQDYSPSYIWFKFKETITVWAKRRSHYLKKVKDFEYQRMLQFYDMAMEDLSKGIDCQEEIKLIISDLNKFYNKNVQKKIDDSRYLEIKDNVYDIIKKQKETKYRKSGLIDQIKIDGVVYRGNMEIIDAIERKMRNELTGFNSGKTSLPDDKEKQFLDFLPKLDLEPFEVENLEKDISEDEIAEVLDSNEIDLDSSPGYDGITYRFIRFFWKNKVFRKLYLNFLNSIKESGDFGPIDNCGVMVLKNKKGNSIEYSKKRKLTKMCKDVNLLGKIWTNRCKSMILDKIVPKSQYVCRSDQTISDEIRKIRDVNLFLLEGNENGSILSLDYADAFRSVSLEWFAKVMDALGFPLKFRNWFWHMVNDIGIVICVNRWKSSVILNKRGFMEGFPPSMPCWVLSSMALILAMESKLEGIQLPDGRNFKDCNFADDQKLFLKHAEEVHTVDKIVSDFEKVSGVKLHRNKLLKKCNVLSFGLHRNYKEWPDWVNKVDTLKVIGGTFINQGSLDKINSANVKTRVIGKLNENWGMGGTLFQKAFFCNTYCFSKMNYLGQAFVMEKKHLDEIKSKSLAFMYAGFNERPVQVLNFRKKSDGGLSLHHPHLKAKSLLLKNMYRECIERNIKYVGGCFSENLYGPKNELAALLDGNIEMKSKEIYGYLREKLVRVNSSLIPSRIERRVQGIQWSRCFKNMNSILKISPKEKEFFFMLTQDILPVHGRLNRKNSDKRCLRFLKNGTKCAEVQDRLHFFVTCPAICDTFIVLKNLVIEIVGKNVTDIQILHVSFAAVDKKVTALVAWLVTKFLFRIFDGKLTEQKLIFKDALKEMSFYNQHFEGTFKGELFKDLMEAVRSKIRGS